MNLHSCTSPKLVLASASPRRAELLSGLVLTFSIEPSNIDEQTTVQDPAKVVLSLAKAKAEHVLRLMNSHAEPTLVLGADTIVVLNNQVIGKPNDRQHAYEMLTQLSGKCHQVFTGIAVMTHPGQQLWQDFDISKVYFRPIEPAEIDYYLSLDEAFDKAGAYALQGVAASFVEKIQGCYTNIIGLPLPKTIKLLRSAGLCVMGSLK